MGVSISTSPEDTKKLPSKKPVSKKSASKKITSKKQVSKKMKGGRKEPLNIIVKNNENINTFISRIKEEAKKYFNDPEAYKNIGLFTLKLLGSINFNRSNTSNTSNTYNTSNTSNTSNKESIVQKKM